MTILIPALPIREIGQFLGTEACERVHATGDVEIGAMRFCCDDPAATPGPKFSGKGTIFLTWQEEFYAPNHIFVRVTR